MNCYTLYIHAETYYSVIFVSNSAIIIYHQLHYTYHLVVTAILVAVDCIAFATILILMFYYIYHQLPLDLPLAIDIPHSLLSYLLLPPSKRGSSLLQDISSFLCPLWFGTFQILSSLLLSSFKLQRLLSHNYQSTFSYITL